MWTICCVLLVSWTCYGAFNVLPACVLLVILCNKLHKNAYTRMYETCFFIVVYSKKSSTNLSQLHKYNLWVYFTIKQLYKNHVFTVCKFSYQTVSLSSVPYLKYFTRPNISYLLRNLLRLLMTYTFFINTASYLSPLLRAHKLCTSVSRFSANRAIFEGLFIFNQLITLYKCEQFVNYI